MLFSVMWSQEYQNEYLDMNHRIFDTYDWVQGELMWNFADFQTTEGIMRVNGNKKGAFTRQRQPKDVAYLLKNCWTTLPVDYKADKSEMLPQCAVTNVVTAILTFWKHERNVLKTWTFYHTVITSKTRS